MFWRGKKNLSHEDVFDQVENEGFARLDDALNYISPLDHNTPSNAPDSSEPSSQNIEPPEGLADRTCQQIWNVADHPEQYPELFASQAPSNDPSPSSLNAPATGAIHPKRVRLRGKDGSSPFVIKSMTVYEADPDDLAPRSPSLDPTRSAQDPPKVGIPTLMYETPSDCAPDLPKEASEESFRATPTQMYDAPLTVAERPFRATPTQMYDAPLTVAERPFVAVAMRMYRFPLQVENDPSIPVPQQAYASPLVVEPNPLRAAVQYASPLAIELPPLSPAQRASAEKGARGRNPWSPSADPLADSAFHPIRQQAYASALVVKPNPFPATVQYPSPLTVAPPPAAESAPQQEDIKPQTEKKSRYSSPLLNGEIRKEAQDEYYWEYLPPETEIQENEPHRDEISVSEEESESAPLTSTVTRIGSGTITEVRRFSSWLGLRHDRPKAEKSGSEENPRTGGVTDILVSVVLGILIAAIVIFPLCRFCVNELALVIAKSNIRRIGQAIQVNQETNEIETAPLWTEQLLHPQTQEVILEPIPEPNAPSFPEEP